MIYVIGSGPAGVSCADALLKQGLEVTILDAGVELEPDRAAALTQLRASNPSDWRGERVQFIKSNVAPDRKGVGLKYAYGSDFPYRGIDQLATLNRVNADTSPSLARGGFSNVWGSAVMPYIASDIPKWPITIDELAPHYKAVLEAMNLSATNDDLATLFPLYTDQARPLRSSRQGQAFLADLGRNKSRMDEAGVKFGSARVAVRAEAVNGSPGCVYCGLCMYGCPNQLIYNSSLALDRLIGNPNLTYIPNVIVHRIEEVGGQVRIHAKHRDGSGLEAFVADRVYLACGVVSSTQILLESLEAFDKPTTLLDSCYFLLPLLRYSGMKKAAEESLHTLAQAFLEIVDPGVAEKTVHLQVYTYNDLYEGALRKMFGPLFGLAKPGVNAILSRLLILQGYLHSDLSPSMKVTLLRGDAHGKRELRIEGEERSTATTLALKRVTRTLWKIRRSLRAVPASPMLHVPPPGRGFHSGGTFPMSSNPSGFQSDVLGRPIGFQRLHVVDSTCLPSIPATTITFSVMANAHRIASRHHEL